ncbi:LacI family DNA-binding transcriptional regulator [Martelella radicis]|uniref:DNA-binding LacI/PurR family transcriptional regulator n=1 Tax=Martelella radicis TaxID=1397476 RepID=A0A7W6KG50_9HYPH|nr:LacI family DNA-binding transcriptional regulator [Martelella radicis]MBB4120621.1 DNA-binding LacI/PurR family transcriptional regulator [Martelella radicis]
MAKGGKVGMREVSERAGVAISTVSHVLNGTAPISDEVRERVLSAAREIGYLARRSARASVNAVNRVLLAVPEDALPDSDVNLVSWTILNALTRDCEMRGVRLVPHTLRRADSVDRVDAAARAAKADGIIVINDDRSALLDAIGRSGMPAVLINGEDPNMHIDSVTPGNRFAALKATRVIMDRGHRRIVHLTWAGRKTVERRLDGFLDAFRDRGLPLSDAIVVRAEGFEPQHGEEALTAWLEAHPDRDGATALFCAADNLAFGAMRALKRAGLSVPDDLSVMGFDGVALGELHSPPLTTVSIPLEQFGRAALDLLEARAKSGQMPRAAHRLELGCDVILRESVAAPASQPSQIV